MVKLNGAYDSKSFKQIALELLNCCWADGAPDGMWLFAGGEFALPEGAEAGRWVLIEGALNTRDLGGYTTADSRTVRWNTVYRSGELSQLNIAGCRKIQDLGIKTVIDFRNRLSPLPFFEGDVWCVHQVAKVLLFPIRVEEVSDVTQLYWQSVEQYADSYRSALEQLANPDNLPLLYHCAAGKDRTGIMTALVLLLLGVDRATVVMDYMLSELIYDTLSMEAMEGLIDRIEATGGIETYLETIGVSPSMQTAIQNNLLE